MNPALSAVPVTDAAHLAPPDPGTLRILAGLARGRTEQQIASDLGMTKATVHERLMAMHRQYDVSNSAALVWIGYRRGWFAGLRPEHRQQLPHLSVASLDLVAMVAIGCTNEEAAEHLGVGREAVRSRLRRIMLPLQAINRAHLVALSYQFEYLRVPVRAAERPAAPLFGQAPYEASAPERAAA